MFDVVRFKTVVWFWESNNVKRDVFFWLGGTVD